MRYNPLHYPYPSQRTAVYSRKGMVATSQHLAAQAGLEILKKGGNAIDAAVATAACLTVVQPTSNGIGGDAFALVWFEGKLYGLNASGPAPENISLEKVRSLGYAKMPDYGWLPVTVPGAPAAWAALAARFGQLPLMSLLRPAVVYAEEGYPVSPILAKGWRGAFEEYKGYLLEGQFAPWFQTFAPQGSPPRTGEVWRSPHHACTLKAIGETEAEEFYCGSIAEKIVDFSDKYDGYLRKEDLHRFRVEWVEPLSVNYKGVDVYELPPNGQGLVALLALNILKGFDINESDLSAYHKQIEAIKLAFADGEKHIRDPKDGPIPLKHLLSEAYASERRQQVGKEAIEPLPGSIPSGGTVYLATADESGNMVSFIQSNYKGFGSGLVVPGTGIALQNRGCHFSLDPSHPNCLAPGKRSYHTIIPGFLARDGNPLGPFGVMGGMMQPQGHVQLLMNLIDYNLNPQAALDAPRWRWQEGKKVEVEETFSLRTAEGLAKLGHEISLSGNPGSFGLGQIILRDANGVLAGGTDPRADGTVASW